MEVDKIKYDKDLLNKKTGRPKGDKSQKENKFKKAKKEETKIK